MPDLSALAAEARRLAASNEHLAVAVETNSQQMAVLTDEVNAQGRWIQKAKGLFYRTWVFIALLALLAGLIGILLFRQVVTEDRLNQVITAEQDARAKGQCPLLALFIGSYNPNSRAAGEDRQKYEDAFQVIRQSYADLDCAELTPVVPGSTSTPPPAR